MRALHGNWCPLEQRQANQIAGWYFLDTVEVIGSIPVAPIVPILNHFKTLQPFNSPSLTPAFPQLGNIKKRSNRSTASR